jgi:biopolymer transport protein TolR
MAMSTRGGGDDLNAEINVTPMIDVMLVLLVIFMVTAPLLNTGVDIDLPQVTAQSPEDPKGKLVLSIDSTGHLFLGATAIKWTELQVKLSSNERVKTESALYIEADAKLAYEYVVTAMAIAKDAGVEKVMMLTEPTGNLDLAKFDAK